MKTLDEIKQLMAAGETVQAEEALKELLAKEPDNLQAKMLYGTCRQFLGDEETFKRIHDELVPRMETKSSDGPNIEEAQCWNSYKKLFTQLSQNALCDGRNQRGGGCLNGVCCSSGLDCFSHCGRGHLFW